MASHPDVDVFILITHVPVKIGCTASHLIREGLILETNFTSELPRYSNHRRVATEMKKQNDEVLKKEQTHLDCLAILKENNADMIRLMTSKEVGERSLRCVTRAAY